MVATNTDDVRVVWCKGDQGSKAGGELRGCGFGQVASKDENVARGERWKFEGVDV